MSAVRLTSRDLEVLAFVGQHKAAPADVLANRFFAENNGRPNADPAHACRRRLAALAEAGYLQMRSVPGQKSGWVKSVSLSRRAATAIGAPRPTQLHPKGRAHHMATLRAIEQHRAVLERRGESIVSVTLEHALRSQQQTGRATQRGESFSSFPDAVLVVKDAAGVEREVALEYVTSKYTNQMIVEKANDFTAYSDTIWVADGLRTAQRVEGLVAAGCTWL